MSVTHRQNFAAFVARLVSFGICNGALAGCALLTFREALEFPRRTTASDDGLETTIAGLLPAVFAFLLFAADKIVALSDKSFSDIDVQFSELGQLAQDAQVASSGFNSSRWTFWKERLTSISKCEQQKVGEEAGRCLKVMNYIVKQRSGRLNEMYEQGKEI